ncbi:glycoside hydrolase [Neurospora hispaniola]|uniref:Glycoside hydrolase n=1 Tax=Neurospora hispaniola TaxID=588809 RepID=A0AAJ0I9X9_9PEZI|nr:glycoside hydrolase [Neurospora hispaniola]
MRSLQILAGVAGLASMLSPIQASTVIDASTAAKAAIDAMNNAFYNPSEGRWSPDVAWWISGTALQAVLDYMHVTGSRDYLSQAHEIIEKQKAPLPWWPQGGGNFRADSTDDTGWWALAMLRMFDLTGDKRYLTIAMQDEQYIWNYWTDTECGGGIYVDIKAMTYKNAIANALYIKLAAALHLRTGDARYLTRTLKAHQWFVESGMINAEELVNDGLTQDKANGVCFNNEGPTWSYLQGVVIGGLVELFRTTLNETYIRSAATLANAVISSPRLTPPSTGVLTDYACEGTAAGCNYDQQSFKGIFARNLGELDVLIVGRPYRTYLEQNANSAYQKARNADDTYGTSWSGPFDGSSLAKQQSAASLWVALL